VKSVRAGALTPLSEGGTDDGTAGAELVHHQAKAEQVLGADSIGTGLQTTVTQAEELVLALVLAVELAISRLLAEESSFGAVQTAHDSVLGGSNETGQVESRGVVQHRAIVAHWDTFAGVLSSLGVAALLVVDDDAVASHFQVVVEANTVGKPDLGASHSGSSLVCTLAVHGTDGAETVLVHGAHGLKLGVPTLEAVASVTKDGTGLSFGSGKLKDALRGVTFWGVVHFAVQGRETAQLGVVAHAELLLDGFHDADQAALRDALDELAHVTLAACLAQVLQTDVHSVGVEGRPCVCTTGILGTTTVDPLERGLDLGEASWVRTDQNPFLVGGLQILDAASGLGDLLERGVELGEGVVVAWQEVLQHAYESFLARHLRFFLEIVKRIAFKITLSP